MRPEDLLYHSNSNEPTENINLIAKSDAVIRLIGSTCGCNTPAGC